ncbi:PH domain-containing protein [Flavobacterium psychraquaticum]
MEIIFNKHDSVLISPKEKTEFIKAMLEINPTIDINYKK